MATPSSLRVLNASNDLTVVVQTIIESCKKVWAVDFPSAMELAAFEAPSLPLRLFAYFASASPFIQGPSSSMMMPVISSPASHSLSWIKHLWVHTYTIELPVLFEDFIQPDKQLQQKYIMWCNILLTEQKRACTFDYFVLENFAYSNP